MKIQNKTALWNEDRDFCIEWFNTYEGAAILYKATHYRLHFDQKFWTWNLYTESEFERSGEPIIGGLLKTNTNPFNILMKAMQHIQGVHDHDNQKG